MLSLRYHNPHIGALVLSSPPQRRTVRMPRWRRVVWLPHMVWAFKYTRVPAGVNYLGMYSKHPSSLFFRNEPLTSFDDELFQPVTEHHDAGRLCLPRGNQGEVFDTPMEMVEKLIGMWWAATHYGSESERVAYEFTSRWPDMSLEDVLRHSWESIIPDRPTRFFSQFGHPPTANTLRQMYPAAQEPVLVYEPLDSLRKVLED